MSIWEDEEFESNLFVEKISIKTHKYIIHQNKNKT